MPRIIVSITIDPDIWKNFQDFVADKQPDGDKSASRRVERLVKHDLTANEGLPAVIDVAGLRKQLINLKKKLAELQKGLEPGMLDRFDQLANAYKLNLETYANTADVIRQVLTDSEEDATPVGRILLADKPHENLTLFISMIEICADIENTNKKLMDAHKEKYLPKVLLSSQPEKPEKKTAVLHV